MLDDTAEYSVEEEGHRFTFYCEIIREKLGPLMKYVEGKEDARLLLELGRNYLKIIERDEQGRVINNPEVLRLAGSKPNFVRAYFFVSLLNALYEEGDITDVTVVSRDTAKKAVSSALINQFKIDVDGKSLNHISKSVIDRYDAFGKHKKENRTKFDHDKGLHDEEVLEKDLDFITLGYTLKDNVRIMMAEKSILH